MTVDCLDWAEGSDFTLYHGDCVDVLKGLPDSSVDFSVYSPPFSALYIYSESERDMGNVEDDVAFQAAYAHVVSELLRITKPGRLSVIHVKDLVFYSNSSDKGDRGLRDFTGDCIRTHREQGWTYHSRCTVWRSPVLEMQKSKPDGLLFRNFRLDAARVRQGNPEYMVTFRKWAPEMVDAEPVAHDPNEFPLEVWQEWASPVWMKTDQTNIMNARVARDDEAERHLCPMPLDLIDRAIRLWTNPGDVVCSPFAGVGSEGVGAIGAGRKFIGVELKESYYKTAIKYLEEAERTKSCELPFMRMVHGSVA
jgi:hypothetical protein